eukprot:11163886-Karenia_brevis.AAC.1
MCAGCPFQNHAQALMADDELYIQCPACPKYYVWAKTPEACRKGFESHWRKAADAHDADHFVNDDEYDGGRGAY